MTTPDKSLMTDQSNSTIKIHLEKLMCFTEVTNMGEGLHPGAWLPQKW